MSPDACMRELIPDEPPADAEQRDRMLWHMTRAHYMIALDFHQHVKPKLEAIAKTNEMFERAGKIVKLIAWLLVGVTAFLASLYESGQVWDWMKKHL